MPPPSRVRYLVLGLLCLLAMITYMDRAANGSAKQAIMKDLGVDENRFFIVLMAFQLAYALFEVPSGWLGDTVGPRSTLLRVVLWWSAFVALSAFAGQTLPFGLFVGFGALVVLQFLFGMGEAGAFPNISKALYNWFPASDRGFAKSAIWMSARFMGGMTPLVWTLLVGTRWLHWREAMWLFAGIAAAWCVLFACFFKNKPREHSWVNREERRLIDRDRAVEVKTYSVPWGILLSSPNLWALCCMYVVTNFCWYFLMYNLPRTLQTEYADWNTSLRGKCLLALLSGMPLLVGMGGCLLGGLISDRYIRRTGDRAWGRRLPGMIGYGGAGLCYISAAAFRYFWPENLWLFAGSLILMGFLNDLIMAPAWAAAQDIGQQYAATVAGMMNMFGNLFGAVATILITGLILERFPNEGIYVCFLMYGVVYFLGVVAWLFVDASKPIVADSHHAESDIADAADPR